jgi:hypothetical protein
MNPGKVVLNDGMALLHVGALAGSTEKLTRRPAVVEEKIHPLEAKS